MECSLGVVAFRHTDGLSPACVMRDLYDALSKLDLSVVGLKFLSPSEPAWPEGGTDQPVLLGAWAQSRPSAAAVAEIVADGKAFVLLACEGPQALVRLRRGIEKVRAAAGPSASSLETYASASGAEAAADVAHLFDRLHSARHYIVREEDA
eukprot:TRINITY_DN43067_c0_g1_i1.p2 TRINITY_DN43067_c0_g1~~TRINITY_DN43067_c0_g1_i1.p2  ORF type:complete len:151 (-),score=21.22 TRINITY_DN43067_c0_g1_i1:109-561(-)